MSSHFAVAARAAAASRGPSHDHWHSCLMRPFRQVQSYLEPVIFRAWGAPVSIHWSVLLVLLIAYAATNSAAGTLCATAAFISLMLVHELGHAVVARRCGLDVLAIRIFLFHGFCAYEAAPTEQKTVAVTWGGVAAQSVLLLFAVSLSGVHSALGFSPSPALNSALFVWVPLNIFIIVFNLLPFPGMDGATAWRAVPIALGSLRGRAWRRAAANVVDLELRRHRDRMR